MTRRNGKLDVLCIWLAHSLATRKKRGKLIRNEKLWTPRFTHSPTRAQSCKTEIKSTNYTLNKCKHAQIPTCVGTNATLVYYDASDAKCAGATNGSKTYVTSTCTQTGPKTARTSKLVTCF